MGGRYDRTGRAYDEAQRADDLGKRPSYTWSVRFRGIWRDWSAMFLGLMTGAAVFGLLHLIASH